MGMVCPPGAAAAARPHVTAISSWRVRRAALRDVRQNRVVDDADRRVRVHLDRVETLVSNRLGERDGLADVPVRARLDVHAARVALHEAFDGVVELLLVLETARAAEVEIRVAAGLFDALVQNAPDVAQPLFLRHRWRGGRRSGSRLAAAAAGGGYAGGGRPVGDQECLRTGRT